MPPTRRRPSSFDFAVDERRAVERVQVSVSPPPPPRQKYSSCRRTAVLPHVREALALYRCVDAWCSPIPCNVRFARPDHPTCD
jgi:hypothetical protein